MARIDHYELGRIVVDGRQETMDLVIMPDRVMRNWWRQDGHMRPDPDTIQRLQDRDVTVEALPTGQAVRRFAELDPARAAAALHLLLTHRAGIGDPVRQCHTGSVATAGQTRVPAETWTRPTAV